MQRGMVALVAAATVLVGVMGAQVARADEPAVDPTAQRSFSDLGLRRIDPALLDQLRAIPGLGPASLKPAQRIDVIVQLSGRPVSAIEADHLERTGRRLSAAERAAFAAEVGARQDAVRSRVSAIGGRVQASFRHALNGIRVSIPNDRVGQLARLSGVERVMAVPIFRLQLVQANTYVASPKAWALTDALSSKVTGEGVTIAVIDTGIDYKHADFGGSPGSTFPTAKVVGGWDFAGEEYNADLETTPAPDADPLDCHGHGTHVAGIAAGFGVSKSGGVKSTYTGAYNATALSSTNWVVPPGVAPRAKLVALKVFGCSGSTDLVVDAIDHAVAMGSVDVINLSLGSVFARGDDATATAVAGAADAGIVVVGSAGNSGPSAYIHGGVTTGDEGISVAAVDARRTINGSSNPDYKYLAFFSSGGPRNGDSALKPDITAPGVGVFSAAKGSGTAGVAFSGTSMASPVVAGAAGLIVQKNPAWTPAEVKSALMGTTGAGKKKLRRGQYDPRLAGAGALNAFKATDTVAYITADDPGGASLSFGYDEISGSFSEQRTFTLVNRGNKSITYNIVNQFIGGSRGATVTFSRTTVTVAPNSSEDVTVTLALSAAAVQWLPEAFTPEAIANNGPSAPVVFYQTLNDIAGVIKAKPTTTGGHRYPLRLPYLAAPRGVSDIAPLPPSTSTAPASLQQTLVNSETTGNHAGSADIFAWGLSDAQDGFGGSDLRAVGVQQFVCEPVDGCATDDRLMYFTINTWDRWSTASTEEFDVLIDLDGDEVADYAVMAGDFGRLIPNADLDGTAVVITCELDASGACASAGFFDGLLAGGQPLNGGTILLPTLASWMGLTAVSDTFRYTAASTSIVPSELDLPDSVNAANGDPVWAAWHPHAPAVSTGELYNLAPGQSVSHQFTVNVDNSTQHGSPLGWMVVTLEDRSGASQAELIAIPAE